MVPIGWAYPPKLDMTEIIMKVHLESRQTTGTSLNYQFMGSELRRSIALRFLELHVDCNVYEVDVNSGLHGPYT